MSTPSVRPLLLVALACAAAAPAPATAQSSARERERARIEREREWERERERAEDARRDRLERERRERERVARLRAEQQRRDHALRLERERRERELRLARERRERDAYARRVQGRFRRDEDRPRVSLSGGIDVREFDGDNDRFVVHGGVDFRSRSGLGMRPEVLFAWSDRGQGEQFVSFVNGVPNTTTLPAGGRSRALGVTLNATYTFFRSSSVRPYVLGGPGVVSTRMVLPVVTGTQVQPGGTPISTQFQLRARHELDVGLNTGAGLELVAGPIRLFSEVRYFLTDTALPRGFSGMLPISAGIRF